MSEHTKISHNKVLRITLFTFLALVALIVVALTGTTLYLTPERLTRIVNTESSKYIKANVKASNIRFTFWSTFPHLELKFDSISIISKTLEDATPQQLAALPQNSDLLASAGKFSGSINLLGLLKGDVSLKNVSLDSLRLNIVAYNDSVNNYNILPDDATAPKHIPEISAQKIELTNPQLLTYYSAATNTSVVADIKDVLLCANTENRSSGNYQLSVGGNVTARVDGMDILRSFPFSLVGNIDIQQDPLHISVDRYSVGVGNTSGTLNLDLNLGDTESLKSFRYDTAPFDVEQLLSYFPVGNIPAMNNLKAELPLSLSARLVSPYDFSSQTLPSLEVLFNIPRGKLAYVEDAGTDYHIDNLKLNGTFFFDGTNPKASYVNIPDLGIESYGIHLNLSARVNNVMTSPDVSADVNLSSSLDTSSLTLPFDMPVSLKGNADARSHVAFVIPDINTPSITELNIKGNINVSNFQCSVPQQHLDVMTPQTSLDFNANLENPTNPDLKIKANIASAQLSAPDAKVALSKTALSLALKKQKWQMPKLKTKRYADADMLAQIGHTDVDLTVNAPTSLRNFLKNYTFTCSFNSKALNYNTKSGKTPVEIRNLDLTATPDGVTMRPMRFTALNTSMTLAGKLTGLRNWIVSGKATPLYADINAALDTVNINQLAFIYEKAIIDRYGSDSIITAPKSPQLTAGDTLAMLLPRNIKANIHATAKETLFTNLHLCDLDASVNMNGGVMNISKLLIGSDFGHARLDCIYNSENIENMNVALNLGLDDIELVTFFKRFHALLVMEPELANLSGELSFNCRADMNIFPDMYLNVPSVDASVGLKSDNLMLHQSRFIHKVARMLLIHTDKDLHIADMDIRADVRNNLVELHPFVFQCDRYKLQMVGINNFAGDMYYHVGVEKSPIPFDFGINVSGNFSHPKLHFGGAKFKANKAQIVSSNLEENIRINIIHEMRFYLRRLVHKAAKSYTPAYK